MNVKYYFLKVKRKLHLSDPVKSQSNRHLQRFQQYAFHGNKCNDEKQYEAVITRWYHTIEKGLAYLNYRASFGKKNIESLLTSMENYVADGYSTDAFFFRTALSTLDEYVRKNKSYGAEDSSLEERIKALGGTKNSWGGVLQFSPLQADAVRELGYKDFILNRHSIRHFSDVPVSLESVKGAIELAQHTPSACNRQGWRCIVINSKDMIAKVLQNQNGNEGFGQEFDKLLLVTADLRYFNMDRELFQAYIDGGMYAQSILNSLHYEHIATVPLSASLREEQEYNVRSLLGIHDAEVLIMFIGIGNYPDECQTTRSERKPVVNIQVI